MRRIRIQEKKKPGEFRMLRCLSIDENVGRLTKHVQRLQRKHRNDRAVCIMRLKKTISQRRSSPHHVSD